MIYQLIEEAAMAGANRTLGTQFSEYDILDLVNDICDTTFTAEEAIGRVIAYTYTCADIFWRQSLYTADMAAEDREAKSVEYAIKKAEEHAYYRDVELYYADRDDPRYTQH